MKEWQGEVVFLHEVIPGAADHSYGIQVAKLAGLPASVIERAKVVLAMLEAEDRATPRGFDDLPLFAAPAAGSSARSAAERVRRAGRGAGGDPSRRIVAARGARSALRAQAESSGRELAAAAPPSLCATLETQ